jgi:hypothetical protein
MLLWMKMNSKYLTKNMILRIMSNDSLAFFKENMLVPPAPATPNPMTGQLDQTLDPLTGQPATPSPYGMNEQAEWGQGEPIFPVTQGKEIVPKFQMDQSGTGGELIVEPKDLAGVYDYIPDVESMSIQNTEQSKQKMTLLQTLISSPVIMQLLQLEGQKPKISELLTETMEDLGFKDAKRFFEQAEQPQMGEYGPAQAGQPLQGGTPPPQGVVPGSPNGQLGGVQPGGTPNLGGQAEPVVPRPF